MFPASNKGGGQTASFPDVCKVPAPPAPFVPIPFPNMMQNAQLGNVVDVRAANGNVGAKIAQRKAIKSVQDYMGTKVSSATQAVLISGSKVRKSHGNEAGTLKGMVSMKNVDKASLKMGSSSVKFEGSKVVTHLSPTAHNSGKSSLAPGTQVAPSQTKVILGGPAFNPMAGTPGVDFTSTVMEEEEELQM